MNNNDIVNNRIKSGEPLFKTKSKCCGCGSCSFVCPVNAITMKEDRLGFIYPSVDNKKCVGCKKCIQVCSLNKPNKRITKKCYAGINLNDEQRNKSTSAGIFSAVSTAFINNGDFVSGAVMDINQGQAQVYHKLINKDQYLSELQGSKYVQSNFWNAYPDIIQALRQGKNVLISGTPCQISSVISVFDKYRKQIFTIDLVCHGVPNIKMFNSYLDNFQKSENIQLKSFCFRDKDKGWGHSKSSYTTNDSLASNKKFLSNYSYYYFFMQSEIARPSCYSCPYACPDRVGDITIGDYWGVEQYSPEILKENGGSFDKKSGISCILVNTEKGNELLSMAKDSLELAEIDFSKVMIRNTQLRQPARHTKIRDKVFSLYLNKGYDGVEKYYRRLVLKRKVVTKLKRVTPRRIVGYINRKLKIGIYN